MSINIYSAESFTKSLIMNAGIKTIWRDKPEWILVSGVLNDKSYDEPAPDVFYSVDVILLTLRLKAKRNTSSATQTFIYIDHDF